MYINQYFMKIILIFIFTGLIFIVACNKDKKSEQISKNKLTDSVKNQNQIQNDTAKNQESGEVYISSVGKNVKVSELKDDTVSDLSDYIGVYTIDQLKSQSDSNKDWEVLNVFKEGKGIFGSISYFKNGSKIEEIRLVGFSIDKNVLKGIIIKYGAKQRFEGRFVMYPYETEESDAIYGFLAKLNGKFTFYELEN